MKRRIVAWILAGTLVLSNAAPAWAAEDTENVLEESGQELLLEEEEPETLEEEGLSEESEELEEESPEAEEAEGLSEETEEQEPQETEEPETYRADGAAEPVKTFSFENDLDGSTMRGQGRSEYDGEAEYADGYRGKGVVLGNYGLELNQLNLGETHTVSLWVKRTADMGDFSSLLYMGAPVGAAENWVSIAGQEDDGSHVMAWTNGDGFSWKQGINDVEIPQDEWTLVTVAQDAKDLELYINGELAGSMQAARSLAGEKNDICVGINNWDPVFPGVVDEIQVYDQALTAEQVSDLYDSRLEQDILAKFTFDEEETGFESENAKAEGTYNSLAESYDGQALYLDGSADNFLTVTDKDGGSLLTGLDEMTISYDAKPDRAAANWVAYAAPDNRTQTYGKEQYVGLLQKDGTLTAERYHNTKERPASASAATGNDWAHVDVVYTQEDTAVYVNGAEQSRVESEYGLADLLGENSILLIGKANWGNGEYYKGWIDNFQIVGKALDEEELQRQMSDNFANALLEQTAEKIQDITIGDQVTNLPDYDGLVTWKSNMPEITIAENGLTATAQQPEAGEEPLEGTLTAVIAIAGRTLEVEVGVTVKAQVSQEDAYGYLMVHFIEDSAGYAEKIYLDISRGDNPQQWDPLNGGEPILASSMGTSGSRDPFLTYNPETETYYILATDLRVFGGDGKDWDYWGSKGSTKMNIWESKDLIHWSEQRQFDVALNAEGEKQAELGMMWAPEATWVPDYYGEGQGAFVVYWSSRVFADDDPNHDGASQSNIMWGVTTDFTQESYEYGGEFLNGGTAGWIDTDIIQNGNKTYHITKSHAEQIIMEVTEDERWWEPGTKWTRVQSQIGKSRFGSVEGPAAFKDHSQDNMWYLFVDDLPTPGYQPMYSTNLDEGWDYLDSEDYYLRPYTKHGGVISLTKGQYDAIRSADAESAVKENLGSMEVEAGTDLEEVKAQLPDTTEVNLYHERGTAERSVDWNLDGLDLEKPGVYTLTGTVDTIGANKNQWVGKDGSTDWDCEGKEPYSSTAVTVKYTVTVKGEPLEGLVLEYNFESSDGSTVTDTAGDESADNGTLYGKAGIVQNDEKASKVLSLDGSSGTYLEFPKGFFDERDTMTITMDVKSDLDSGFFFTFAYGANDKKYNFLRVRGQEIRDAVTTNGNGGEKEVAYNNGAEKGKWQNVALVVDGAALKLYVDGELVSVNKDTGITTSDLGENLLGYLGKSFYSADPYFKGSFDNVRVYDRALASEEISNTEETLNDLTLPYVISEKTELPSSVAGTEITWSCKEGDLLDENGRISAPESGYKEGILQAEYTVNGEPETKEFGVKVIEKGASYLVSYTRSISNAEEGAAMHLGFSADGEDYEALNDNTGILYPKTLNLEAEGDDSKTLSDPYIFRMKDNTFGIVAVRGQTNGTAEEDKGRVFFATSEDLLAYDEIGMVDLKTEGTIRRPVCEYDALNDTYRISWKGEDGKIYTNTIQDLTGLTCDQEAKEGGSLNKETAEVSIAGAFAGNVAPVTKEEATAIKNRLMHVVNTDVTLSEEELTVKAGETPDLSKITAAASYSDGQTMTKQIEWDDEDIDWSVPGNYEVKGTIKQYENGWPIFPNRADPYIYRWNGDYYFIGTNEAGQSSIYIRRADSIWGLKDAKDHLILNKTASGDGSGCLWAPELHEIGGELYLFLAISTNGSWNAVQSRVMKLKSKDADPLDADSWEAPVRVVKKDGSPLCTDGITLDMTHFEWKGQSYVSWAQRKINPTYGSNIMIATIDPKDPTKLTSDPVLICEPDYGWDRNTTPVDEGPYALTSPNGDLYITFSGAGVNNSYCVGYLKCTNPENLLDRESWQKSNYPILKSASTDGVECGPGHNAYVTDEDGEVINVYHAKYSNGGRQGGIRRVYFATDGTPVLDMTTDREILPENKEVTLKVTVTGNEADTSRLEAAIEKAKAYKEADYAHVPEAYEALQKVIAKAEEVLNGKNPTQKEIDEQTDAVNKAAEALEAADQEVKEAFQNVMPEVTATERNGSVAVEWNAVENAKSYRIYRKEAGGSFKGLANVNGDILSYADKTAEEGKTYYYTVKGFWEADAQGVYTKYPTDVKVEMPVKSLETPAVKTRSVNYCTVEVTWNKIAGAEKYVVYRKEAKAGTSFKSIGTVSGNTLKYRDGNAKMGVNYYYTVKAFAGTVCSDYQKTVTGKAVPSSPTLKAASSSKGVTVTWTGSKAGANKFADGYRIFRKTENGSWKTVGTVGKNVRSFTDTTGTKGTSYTYTVRAYVKQSNGTNLWGTYNTAGVTGAKK